MMGIGGDSRRDAVSGAAAKLLLSGGTVSHLALTTEIDEAVARSAIPKTKTLVRTISRGYFAELDEAVSRAVDGIDDPVEQLVARGRAYVEFGMANAAAYRLIFMARPEFREFTALDLGSIPTFQALVENIQACHDSDPAMVSFFWWTAVHGLVSLLITGPFDAWPQVDLIDSYLDAYIRRLVA